MSSHFLEAVEMDRQISPGAEVSKKTDPGALLNDLPNFRVLSEDGLSPRAENPFSKILAYIPAVTQNPIAYTSSSLPHNRHVGVNTAE